VWIKIAVLTPAFCAVMAAQSEIDVRTGVFRDRAVTYQVMNGLAVLEGDMILGTPAELEAAKPGASKNALILGDTRYRWTNATIPYRIDDDVPNPRRILDAVAHWNSNTPIQLTPDAGETNRLRFVRENNFGICFSSVGMIGGEQTIRVDDQCTAGALIHEIGHTVGFYHEQARIDRDRYVNVAAENINKSLLNNFGQNFGAQETGPYDYGSIMHYARFSDARNVFAPTIETIPAGMSIGQLTVLSPQEILVVNQMYGQPDQSTVISSNPVGLTIMVDGAAVTTPQAFDWPTGSSHTIEAEGRQRDANVRYVFGRWSDEGDAAHTITAGDAPVFSASFIQEFPLKTSIVGSGTIKVDPPSDDGFYPTGSIVTLTATPAAGNSFLHWTGFISVLQGGLANPATLRVNFQNANYVANFIPRSPTAVSTDPPGLAVTVDGSSTAAPRGFDWAAGSTHTLAVASTIAPAAGVRYVFERWSDGGAPSHSVVAGAPVTYTAVFKRQYQLLTNTGGTGGRISVSPPSSDGFYDEGTTVQLRGLPTSGFTFGNWSGDLRGAAASNPIVMNDQQLVNASFVLPGGLAFNSVAHAATLQPGAVAPGEELVIFGSGIGPDPGVTVDPGATATILGGTRVLFDGAPAPLLSASAGLVTALVPSEIAGQRTTLIQLEVNGRRSGAFTFGVLDAQPGLFTADSSGGGQAQAINEDGQPNSAANPAAGGSVISLWATGIGLSDSSGSPVLPVQVRIGGKDADLLYAGPDDTQPAGVVRIDARIPAGVARGDAPVRITCGYQRSPAGTTVAVQ
jgi:uncharacterized protein (TIGR03437 family)